jgi:hypothetical protein
VSLALTILWYAAGLVLAVAMFTLTLTIAAAGELRGGLEIWNDAWWRLISGGRWNVLIEDDDLDE